MTVFGTGSSLSRLPGAPPCSGSSTSTTHTRSFPNLGPGPGVSRPGTRRESGGPTRTDVDRSTSPRVTLHLRWTEAPETIPAPGDLVGKSRRDSFEQTIHIPGDTALVLPTTYRGRRAGHAFWEGKERRENRSDHRPRGGTPGPLEHKLGPCTSPWVISQTQGHFPSRRLGVFPRLDTNGISAPGRNPRHETPDGKPNRQFDARFDRRGGRRVDPPESWAEEGPGTSQDRRTTPDDGVGVSPVNCPPGGPLLR